MAKPKTIDIRIDEKEPIEEKPFSEKAREFAELIERYKVQNPVKYETKKQALEKRLNALQGK